MFTVIYRGFVHKGHEKVYEDAWKIVATYFVKKRGAIGSTLHRTEEGEYIAYSRWPDRKTRDRSWGDTAEEIMDETVMNAIHALKKCLDRNRPFSEIPLEIIASAI